MKTHSGTNGSEFTFTGEQNDPNGLEYLRARYYDSATGRFLGRDSHAPNYEFPGTLNAFVYVLNNPANDLDPTGAFCGFCKKVVHAAKTVTAHVVVTGPCLALFGGNPLCAVAGAVIVNEVGTDTILQYAVQCVAWGGSGFVAAGPAGAAAACGAAVGALISAEIFGPNPFSECIAWGAYGAVTGGVLGAGISCATGAISYFEGPDNPLAQCFVWAIGAVAGAASAEEVQQIQQAVSSCTAAVVATLFR